MDTDRIARIRSRLEARFAPATVSIRDDSAAHAGHAGTRDGAGHFALRIESPAFAGRGRLQRHRMVYEALAELMPGEIHALNIQALSPDEAEQPRTP